MADLERIRELARQAAAQRDDLTRQIAATAADLAAERARLTAAQAIGDEQAAVSATDAITRLAAVRKSHTGELGRLHDDFARELDDLLGADIELDGDVPLALLPVRIEVRSTPDQASLRVRIFHDAIHAETLDEGLSDAERRAGIAYWNVVWVSGETQAAWPALVAAVGGRRAPWVAEALTPKNLGARPADPPDFPKPSARGTRPAVARTLPDRFYVRVEQDGTAPNTEHGRPIPDELPVGLTAQSELQTLKIEGQDLPPIDESLRWLVEYKEAESLGMAVTVKLPVPRQAVRKLIVYGVRTTLDPLQGATRLEHLVRAHRFSDGAEFVPQGTPTNNTESARTDWSRRTPPGPPSLTAAADLRGGANAAVVAAALGIDSTLLASLPGAGDGEQSRAAAFNTALWTTTWGDAIEHLTPGGRANGDKRLDSPSLEAVRDHWIDTVRGRGPLPAMRLGRQPYGVLPIVVTDASWQPLAGGFVEDRLVPFIDKEIRPFWESAQGDVATLANRPLDTALPEILGTDAVLRALRVRTALSPDPVIGQSMALTLPDLATPTAQPQITKALLVLMGVDSGALDARHLLGKKTRSLALPLVDASDNAFIANLLQPDPASATPLSVLQVLLAHAREVEQHNRESLASPEHYSKLRGVVEATHIEIDRELVSKALDATLQGQDVDNRMVAKAASHLTEAVGRLDTRAIADRNPIAALAPATTMQQLAGMEPSDAYLQHTNVGLQLVGEIFHASQWAARFRAALETISKIESLDERRLLLAETLDCCSHRLDAWITSAATRRLSELRAGGAQGIFIGAYGWLENIELDTPSAAGQVDGQDVLHDKSDGGFIHAPGLTHAATAGVLRSGRLTHRRGDSNDDPLDIDLSSTRVRDALALLDGMRRGQPLGALLGYRLERRLHERSGNGLELDRFIYVLRTLAPLRAGKLTEPDQPVQESLAASDVVDALKLMEIPWATVKAKLTKGPDDYERYIPDGTWVAPSDDEAGAIEKAIGELEQTHDAVADLLLAESVHQLVSGNPERAAAVLDALGAGEAVPPEPQVVRTPRTGNPIQHRIAIVVPDPPPASAAGWKATAPRAVAERRLEAWAQAALGDPSKVKIAVGHAETLADAGLCALDILYDADGDKADSSTLAARLRHSLGDLGDDFSPLSPTWELAGLLHALLAAGRALDVADVGRPVVEGAVGRIPDSAEIVARATAVKDALATAVGTGDIAALAPFGIRPPAVSAALTLSAEELAAAGEALIAEASARVAGAEMMLARVTPPPPAEPPAPASLCNLAAQALAAIFGAGFIVLPVLSAAPAGEKDLWADALGPAGVVARPGADIRPWLARAGALRNATSAYGETLLVREAYGRTASLRVVQTPAGGYSTWAGLPFPDGKPPLVPLQSMVAEVVGNPDSDFAGAIAGCVLDEWTEVVPKRLLVGDPASTAPPPKFVDVTTTGIALNAAAPGARPPQAILLALTPDGGAWSGDRLVAVLDEALALARIRCLTLQQIPFVGEYLPALYFRDWSLQGEPTIDWSKLASVFDAKHAAMFLRVNQ